LRQHQLAQMFAELEQHVTAVTHVVGCTWPVRLETGVGLDRVAEMQEHCGPAERSRRIAVLHLGSDTGIPALVRSNQRRSPGWFGKGVVFAERDERCGRT